MLTDPTITAPLLLTAKVLAYSTLLQLCFTVPLGCWLSCSRTVFSSLVDILVSLPLVFPPIATGFFLLLLFGRKSPLDSIFHDAIIFQLPGLVIAAFIAGMPLVIKPLQAAMNSSEAEKLSELAAVLGKSNTAIVFLVLLPLARRSIIAGLLLAVGRSLGEVGMTLMLGGNIIGRTNTLSLEIYNAVFDGEFERAAFLSLLLAAFSTSLFIAFNKLSSTPN